MNDYGSRGYRLYVLALLTLVYAFNFVDRQLLVILQEPIKSALRLSDTQLGLLSGFTFALFYVSCGIPIARLADRASRRTIVALALSAWSIMTALSGLARNFGQLLLARIGVGVGEAGCSPPIHSMISDIFPPSQRATALSVYAMGVHIGILAAFLCGGWLAEEFGWRTAFMVMGPPGLLLAATVQWTVREPLRTWSQKTAAAVAAPPFTRTIAQLWSQPSFRHLALAVGLQGVIVYGLGNWTASYFLRAFPIRIAELGGWLALTMGLGGAAGAFLGGSLTDRLGKRDARQYLLIPALGIALSLAAAVGMLMATTLRLALVADFVFVFLSSMYLGPVFAVAHALAGPRVRALSSAVLFLASNLIGLGLGPTAIGFLSDRLGTGGTADSLRLAMLSVGIVACLWCALHYVLATRTLRQNLASAPD